MEQKKDKLVMGQFSDAFIPIMDGVSFVVKNYAYWLNKKYGRCYVITTSMPEHKDNEEMPVLRFRSLPLPKRPPYRYGFPRLDLIFQRKLKKINFDIVHAHSPFSAGFLALRTARRLNIPIVATFHTKYKDDIRYFTKAKSLINYGVKMIIKFYHAVDTVWVPNKFSIETLKEYGYKGNIEIMPNATDVIPPRNLSPLLSIANHDFGTIKNEFVLLFVGQHIWEKNLKFLLEAIEKLSRLEKNFKMVFVGGGYARKEMEEIVRERKIRNKIRFLGIVRDRQKIQSYYARADLLIFPSMYDVSPLTLQEAAAFELPALLLLNSTASEGVIDGENGFLSINNTDDYAKKIAYIMDHQELLKKCGQGAYSSFYRLFEPVVDDVFQRYQLIIKRYKKNLE